MRDKFIKKEPQEVVSPNEKGLWTAALDAVGAVNVRVELDRVAGMRADGGVNIGGHRMPKGFAQEWLKWHDDYQARERNRQADERTPQDDGTRQDERMALRVQMLERMALQVQILRVARWSAVSGIAAAVAAFLSLVVTVWLAWKGPN